MALAAVYPVGLQLMACWTAPAHRARALGLLVGVLTWGQRLRSWAGWSWHCS